MLKALKAGAATRSGANVRRVEATERSYGIAVASKASKGKPQERIWDETSSVGYGGSKASEGLREP